MNRNSKQVVVSLALIAAGLLGVFFLSGFVERNRPALPDDYEDSDLVLQGAKIKGYALGFEGLLADWYWMKSLQYIGDRVVKSNKPISLDNMKELNPRLLYPYLDTATTLDPKFTGVYEYGAIVLPSIDNEQAIKIAEKGIANNPDSWSLYNSLGYIYWRAGDFQKSAEAYQRGAHLDGAPPFMQMMAAKMTSDGGSRQTAREIYGQMLDQAIDEQTKQTARLRLWALDAQDEVDLLRRALREFQNKNNRCVANWRELVGEVQKIAPQNSLRIDRTTLAPLDPMDTPYLLLKENNRCDADVDWTNTKLPVSNK